MFLVPCNRFLVKGDEFDTENCLTRPSGQYSSESGTAQTLSYYMAGGEEKLLRKNLLAQYEIIAKNATAQ